MYRRGSNWLAALVRGRYGQLEAARLREQVPARSGTDWAPLCHHLNVADDAPPERRVEFTIDLPPELAGGVYSNFLAVWHTRHEFTLDFASTQAVIRPDDADPDSPVQVPCRVVARVKIPVSVIFDVLRAMNENMTRYESKFGEISTPPKTTEQEEDAP